MPIRDIVSLSMNMTFQNLLFDELTIMDNMILSRCFAIVWQDWEKESLSLAARSPYWVLVGEYRDQTEILVQNGPGGKRIGVWKTELSKAAREPEKMVFSVV